jgi:iron complex transport system ATP-binding protein
MGELSVGQRQRASIARALCQLDDATSPGVTRALLADEPTAALDPRHALEALAIFHQLARDGIAVVAVLHDLAAVAAFDRVLLLGEGGLPIASGTPEQVLTDAPLRSAFGVGFERITSPGGRLAGLVPVATGGSPDAGGSDKT